MPGELDPALQALDGAVLDLVGERAPTADEARRPDLEVMRTLGDRGLLKLIVPESLGGPEVHPTVFMDFTERVAWASGSAGWTAMTCNEEAGIASAFLQAETMAALYAENPTVIIAGSGVPNGRARRVEGGWSITGNWGFVSGCTAADRWILTALVDGSDPLELCHFLIEADARLVEDTWDTTGLRGTGSHNVVLEDRFVEDRCTGVAPSMTLPRPDAPFYRLPSGLRFPFPKVGVTVGLARRAIHEFGELAGAKQPLNLSSSLRERADAHSAIARATALVGSGDAWARDRLEAVWAIAAADDPIPSELHAEARLACSHAAAACIEAVELLVAAAGTTANFRSSPLSLIRSDVRAVAGHFMVAAYQMNTAGRVLLGLDPGDRTF